MAKCKVHPQECAPGCMFPNRETQTSPKNPRAEITSSSKPHPYSAEGSIFRDGGGGGRTQGREQGCPLLRIEAILLSPTQDFTLWRADLPSQGRPPSSVSTPGKAQGHQQPHLRPEGAPGSVAGVSEVWLLKNKKASKWGGGAQEKRDGEAADCGHVSSQYR